MDGGSSCLSDLPSSSLCLHGSLPQRDIRIIIGIIVAVILVPSQSEEFQKLVAPGGVLIRISEVACGLQGVRGRRWGVDVS